jgi:hypothetical protein
MASPAGLFAVRQRVVELFEPREISDDEYLDQAEGEIRGYGRLLIQNIVAIGQKGHAGSQYTQAARRGIQRSADVDMVVHAPTRPTLA